MWRRLNTLIKNGEVDQILHIGDQIDADPIWQRHDTESRGIVPSRADLKQQYRNWYHKTWSQPEVAAVLASCPSLMMWDDHDIYDGWGSNDNDQRDENRVFFESARQVFLEYQLSHGPTADEVNKDASSFAYTLRQGDIGFLVLDGRSNRNYPNSVLLGNEQLSWVSRVLDSCAANSPPKRVFVILGVPPVHAEVAAAISIITHLPNAPTFQEPLDDWRDAWVAPNNQVELKLPTPNPAPPISATANSAAKTTASRTAAAAGGAKTCKAGICQ